MLQFTYAHQNWNMDDWKNNAYNINLQSKTREYQKTKTQTSLIQLNFIKDTHGSIENTHTHTHRIHYTRYNNRDRGTGTFKRGVEGNTERIKSTRGNNELKTETEAQ